MKFQVTVNFNYVSGLLSVAKLIAEGSKKLDKPTVIINLKNLVKSGGEPAVRALENQFKLDISKAELLIPTGETGKDKKPVMKNVFGEAGEVILKYFKSEIPVDEAKIILTAVTKAKMAALEAELEA